MDYITKKYSTLRKVIFGMKIPKTWINSFEQLLKYGKMVNSVPLRFDGKVQPVEKLTSLIFISVTLFVATLNCGYRAWTIYSRPVNEFPIGDFVTEIGNLVAITATTSLGWELLLKRKQCALFFNSVVQLDYDLKRKFGGGHTSQKYKALSRFLHLLVIFSVCYPIFGGIPQQFKDRHHRQYWGSSLLPRSIYDDPIVAVLCLLKLISITVPISVQLKLFSSLKILNILHNEVAAGVLWPAFENGLLVMQVVEHVLMIRFLDNVHPNSVLISQIVLGLAMVSQGRCIKSGAKMVETSTKFKKTVRRFGNKFEKKVAKSLHPLRVNVGSFYYFKKSTFTTFLQTHLDTTINWLLTIP
ncbi:hypothetical protein Fcan01_15442 [Folsomia candida]|uniref:Uncharacterized protein n=1 Tax=Folsomia candida TaxID=158441 RepID=A0A226DYR4_FOLCA|nr:hypothetical protein Fcan01_15442 [Folsomia candida]